MKRQLDTFKFRDITHVFTDFDGVLTANTVYVDDTGCEMVRCSRADGIGIQLLQAADIEVIILSSEENEVVERRAAKLDVQAITGLRYGHQKADEIRRICDPKKAVFIGNDVNDIEALACVGFPVSVADAHLDVLRLVSRETAAKGGEGAFRELAEYLLEMRESEDE